MIVFKETGSFCSFEVRVENKQILPDRCRLGDHCTLARRVQDSNFCPQSGLTPFAFNSTGIRSPSTGRFSAAQLLGYYKDEGLDVTILPLPQYGSVAQLVSSGKADLGLGSSDQILEWNSNGLPLVAVSATMQHDPQAMSGPQRFGRFIASSDFEGRTIAAQTGATWLKYVTLAL